MNQEARRSEIMRKNQLVGQRENFNLLLQNQLFKTWRAPNVVWNEVLAICDLHQDFASVIWPYIYFYQNFIATISNSMLHGCNKPTQYASHYLLYSLLFVLTLSHNKTKNIEISDLGHIIWNAFYAYHLRLTCIWNDLNNRVI